MYLLQCSRCECYVVAHPRRADVPPVSAGTRTAFATVGMGWPGDWLEARLPGPDAGEQSPHVVGARTKRARSRGEVKEDVGGMNDEQASIRMG